jgi:polyisoprenoid-binding protein YceI
MRTTIPFGAILVSILLGATAAAGAPPVSVPEPPVPEAIAARGVVYHTLAGREAQVTFTSDAPLENIVGKSNAVAGYAVAGPESSPAALIGAEWLLPVASLATGIPLRDNHLAGREWLDAPEHPMIRFRLTAVEDVTEAQRGADYSTWSATLVGEMTIRGETRPIRIPDARLSFLDASERTTSIAPGDLLFIKCAYTVRMSEFGIRHKDVPDKVSDEIRLTQLLRLSTVVPTGSGR